MPWAPLGNLVEATLGSVASIASSILNKYLARIVMARTILSLPLTVHTSHISYSMVQNA